MDLETKKLAEQWEYIQGGLFFLDESDPNPEGSCLVLGQGELKKYILSLSALMPKALELIEVLHLDVPAKDYEAVPASMIRLLASDIRYLKEEPAPMDESFGSLAMAAFYQYVSNYLAIPSDTPKKMMGCIEEAVHRELPDIKIVL